MPHVGKAAGARSVLVELTYVVAIAKHRDFRKAGLELGISASESSHALKGLESRLGVRLVNCTNRSVTLTATGQEPCDAIVEPLGRIHGAVENLNWFRDAPRGRVRLNVVADDARATLTMACAGAGLLYGPESAIKPYVERGELQLVLTEWVTIGPGYHLYYSSRRQLPNGIQLLADLIRELRPLGF